MKHFLEVSDLSQISSPMLTEDKSTFSTGDELVITVSGHREQIVVLIDSINRERVFKGWCYLGLRGLDDLSISNVLNKNISQKGAEG